MPNVPPLAVCYVETVVSADEYTRYRATIRQLRNKDDLPPALIHPRNIKAFGHPCSSHLNVCKYINMHPDEGLVLVKGFKLWRPEFYDYDGSTDTVMHALYASAISANFHMLVRRPNGEYIDVTTPEEGDWDKPYVFVPSTKVYEGVSVEAFKHMVDSGIEPIVGMVCMPEGWANWKTHDVKMAKDCLYVHDVQKLRLMVRTSLSRMPRHVRDNLDLLLERGAIINKDDPNRFAMHLDNLADALLDLGFGEGSEVP